jgi:serpin B
MLSTAGLAIFRQRVAATLAPPAVPDAAPVAPDAAPAVAVAPLSIGLALAMLRAAAAPGDATLRELDAVLAFDKHPEATVQGAIAAACAEPVDGLHIANSIWADAAVHPDFADHLRKDFAAEARALAGKDAINRYVEEHTGGLIAGLLQQDPHSTVLLNVLAIEFHWFRKFAPENTIKNTLFYGFDGESRCTMMHRRAPALLSVRRLRSCVVVLLPYANGVEDPIDNETVGEEPFRFAALLVLPNSTGAQALAEAVDDAFSDVRATCARVQTERVLLSMPAFRIESGAVSLRKDLELLGVKTCFTTAAGLDRMAPGGVHVDDVVHSVVIEVDESGTKAAAATAVSTTRGASPPVLKFALDRPFAFGVLNCRTHDMLFTTIITMP